MAFQGNFLFPTCRAAGLTGRALLHNSVRSGEEVALDVRKRGLAVELSVFAAGERLFHAPDFGVIPLDGALAIDATTCPALSAPGELLVLARCHAEGGDGYLAQEHQLVYESHRCRTHLLYDQIPVLPPGKNPSAIVLLAPKAWVSAEVDTFVVFASFGQASTQELQVTLLAENGQVLHQGRESIAASGAHVFNVGARLPADYTRHAGPPRLVNVVARGGAAQFAIMTFVVNRRTGGIALEHSLSPHYYVRDHGGRLRHEALLFPPGMTAP